MLLGGKDMGAVFAPFYDTEFSPLVSVECEKDKRDKDEYMPKGDVEQLGVAIKELDKYSEDWIKENIPKHQRIYPNIRMVCILQNQNIFPLNSNNKKGFDVDCSDGEWDVGNMISPSSYNWNNKIGDKFRKDYRYYIGSMFNIDFQNLVIRYRKDGAKSDKSYVEECEQNILFKNCVSRSKTKDRNGNYRVNKGEDLKWGNSEEWRSLSRWDWGLHKNGYGYMALKKHLVDLNLGYTTLEWNTICGMLDATYFCYKKENRMGGSELYKKELLKKIKDFSNKEMLTPKFLNMPNNENMLMGIKIAFLLLFNKEFEYPFNNILKSKTFNKLKEECFMENSELGEGVHIGDEYFYGFIRALWGWDKMDQNYKWAGFINKKAKESTYDEINNNWRHIGNWRDFVSNIQMNRIYTDE